MIKVNIINGFFMQISRFLHLIQKISELLRGSERVKAKSENLCRFVWLLLEVIVRMKKRKESVAIYITLG